jgi:hypothetical protein
LSNIGIDDLIVQEVVEEFEKACKALEVSPKAFFKMNNNQLLDLGQSQIRRCIVYHNEIGWP